VIVLAVAMEISEHSKQYRISDFYLSFTPRLPMICGSFQKNSILVLNKLRVPKYLYLKNRRFIDDSPCDLVKWWEDPRNSPALNVDELTITG